MLSGGAPDAEIGSKSESLRIKNVLKQALSRNKAHEKQDLWKQKHQEDFGSSFSLSLKSNDGQVRTVALVPEGAQVTDNNVNIYAEERRRVMDKKEDKLLDRLCDGKDVAWKPDSFFEALGDHDVPWMMRPTDFFTNPSMVDRVVCAYEASRNISKKERKTKKKKDKKQKKHDKHKKHKRKDEKKKKKKKRKKDKEKQKRATSHKSRQAQNDETDLNVSASASPVECLQDEASSNLASCDSSSSADEDLASGESGSAELGAKSSPQDAAQSTGVLDCVSLSSGDD